MTIVDITIRQAGNVIIAIGFVLSHWTCVCVGDAGLPGFRKKTRQIPTQN